MILMLLGLGALAQASMRSATAASTGSSEGNYGKLLDGGTEVLAVELKGRFDDILRRVSR